MKKKSKPKNETIGFDIQATKKRIAELLALRQKVAEERDATPQWGETSMKHAILTQQLEAIDNDIIQVREWYTLGVTESLNHESKRLNTLTIVLIGLTATLSILTIIDILSRVIK